MPPEFDGGKGALQRIQEARHQEEGKSTNGWSETKHPLVDQKRMAEIQHE